MSPEAVCTGNLSHYPLIAHHRHQDFGGGEKKPTLRIKPLNYLTMELG